jgi:hypothetical protein
MDKDVREAIERWIADVKPPKAAEDAIRRKFRRLKLTVEEIDTDRLAKVARGQK